MAEAGRDLTDTLFGAPTATAAPVDQWRQTLKLDDLERQYQLPSGLMTSVLRQESGGDPRVKSSAGAQGIFQFMPKTAAAYKIDPFDPQQAAPAAAKELSTLYKKYRGDVDMTLAAWNWGQGNVDRKGMANMPRETRGFLTNVKRFLGPGVAEAATPTGGRDLTGTLGQGSAGSGGGGRDLTDMLFGATPAETTTASPQQPPQATMPTAQPATPASPQVAPTAQQAPPAPSPDPSATPGMRFQALPSITQLEPADRLQKTRDFERLKPALQEEFLRSEEPTAGGLAVGGGPVAQSQAVTDPAALLALGKRAPGWREGDPLPPEAKRPPTPTEAPVTEHVTEPSTMIPLIMGLGIPGLTVAAPGAAAAQGALAKALPKAGPLITRGARAVGEGVSQTLGWTAGKTAETGQVPSPKAIGTEAVLNVGTGGLVEIPSALRGAKNAALRATPGAQILLKNRAVQEAEGLGKRVFNAQDKEVVGKAFDAVIATGEKLDTTPVRTLWSSLTPAEQRIAGNELSKISSTFADALKTKKLGDWDIGDLQHVRSELRTASMSKRTPETQDLLQSLRSSVDEAIHNGMAKGSLPAADLVAAQKAYRKVMQAEDVQGLVRRYTKDSPNLKYQELNLAGLNKELRGGGKKSTQRLVAGMTDTEQKILQDELAALSKRYPFVRVASTVGALASAGGLLYGGSELLSGDVQGASYSLLPAMMHAAARSPRFMGLFKRSILNGKGQLAKHHVDALVNALRHENEEEAPAQ